MSRRAARGRREGAGREGRAGGARAVGRTGAAGAEGRAIRADAAQRGPAGRGPADRSGGRHPHCRRSCDGAHAELAGTANLGVPLDSGQVAFVPALVVRFSRR